MRFSFRFFEQFHKTVRPTDSATVPGGVTPKCTSTRRKRRGFVAFCAALFAVSGTYFIAGTNIPGVTAQEGGSAADFFRADRARYRGQRAYRSLPVLSIFRDRRKGVGQKSRLSRSERRRARRAVHRTSRADTRVHTNVRTADRRLVAKLQKIPGFQPPENGARHDLGTRSVCVRLCDGFSFPVGDYNGGKNIKAHEAICSGLCPGAPTGLYVLSSSAVDVSEAVSARTGKAYAALPIALSYTAKRDRTCTCRAPQQSHMALVSLRRDFTLRKGDAVMTKAGIRVFKGAKRWPFRKRDFSTLRQSRRLLGRNRSAALGSMERASSEKFIALQAKKRLQKQSHVDTGTRATVPSIIPLPPIRLVKTARR